MGCFGVPRTGIGELGNSLSVASAPVVLVLEWPASRAISSTGTPELDISDTNECRNSRGVQFPPILAAVQTVLNSCRTLTASRGAQPLGGIGGPMFCCP